MRRLYIPLDDTITLCMAPVLPPDQMGVVLVHALAWAKDRQQPIYCYQLWTGVNAGCWTCGTTIPADDPWLRVDPNGEVHSGCG